MLPTDELGVRYSHDLAKKATEFVNKCITMCNNTQYIDKETGNVHPQSAYLVLSDAQRLKDITWPKVLLMWDGLLEEHFNAFAHGLVSPLCREWLWTLYREVLLTALGIGLIIERLAIEKQPGMGEGCTPRAHQTLSTKVLLFASDAQFYGFEQREMLQERYKTLRDSALVQGKTFLQRQYEFQV